MNFFKKSLKVEPKQENPSEILTLKEREKQIDKTIMRYEKEIERIRPMATQQDILKIRQKILDASEEKSRLRAKILNLTGNANKKYEDYMIL